jgi:hypothetical protein
MYFYYGNVLNPKGGVCNALNRLKVARTVSSMTMGSRKETFNRSSVILNSCRNSSSGRGFCKTMTIWHTGHETTNYVIYHPFHLQFK